MSPTLKTYQDYKHILSELTPPYAFVDLDYLDKNIQDITAKNNQKPIRIATKSVRCKSLLSYLLKHPELQGLMCYTASEAVFLSRQGFDDLLVAYPSMDRAAIAEVCLELKKGKTIYLMVDHLTQVELIDSIAHSHDVVAPLCIDMDMSSDYPGLHFGVWRSPLKHAHQVLKFAQSTTHFQHIAIRGLMGYEAQIAGVGDLMPQQKLKNKVVQGLQRQSFPAVSKRRQKAVKKLNKAGFKLDFVNGGGTGSLAMTAEDPSVTETTVGSGFYSPVLFDHYSHFQYQPAAAYAIQIVRQPQPHIYTCLGGGYIASGAIGKEKQPLVYLPQGAHLLDLEGAGEVQTPVKYQGDVPLKLGDPVFLRHSKAGELCERFNEMVLIRGKKIEETVKTYRGEGLCFV